MCDDNTTASPGNAAAGSAVERPSASSDSASSKRVATSLQIRQNLAVHQADSAQQCVCQGDPEVPDPRLLSRCAHRKRHACPGVKFHAACADVFTRRPGDRMYCPTCVAQNPDIAQAVAATRAQAYAARARALQHAPLSQFAQCALDQHTERQRAKGVSNIRDLCVRQVECTRIMRQFPTALCKAYADDAETYDALEQLRPRAGADPQVPGHRVTLILFQERGGKDVIMFFIQATEFRDDAPAAFRGTIILDWIDSVSLLQTGAAPADSGKERALVYQELLASYFTFRQQEGFRLALINACAPKPAGYPLSWVLRRVLPEPKSASSQRLSANDAHQVFLLLWYQHVAELLAERHVVTPPQPRAEHASHRSEHAIVQRLWERQDTVSRLAEERLSSGDCSLRGVPLLEKTLVKATEEGMGSSSSVVSGVKVGPKTDKPGSRKRAAPMEPSGAEVLRIWQDDVDLQSSMLVLRLAGAGQPSEPEERPLKARCLAAGCTSAGPSSKDVPSVPLEAQFAVWGPRGDTAHELLTLQHLRFDTPELATHSTHQLLLWMQPGAPDEEDEEGDLDEEEEDDEDSEMEDELAGTGLESNAAGMNSSHEVIGVPHCHPQGCCGDTDAVAEQRVHDDLDAQGSQLLGFEFEGIGQELRVEQTLHVDLFAQGGPPPDLLELSDPLELQPQASAEAPPYSPFAPMLSAELEWAGSECGREQEGTSSWLSSAFEEHRKPCGGHGAYSWGCTQLSLYGLHKID